MQVKLTIENEILRGVVTGSYGLASSKEAQYEEGPHIVYSQNDWVELNNYNTRPLLQLVRLWLLMNHQIVQEDKQPYVLRRL